MAKMTDSTKRVLVGLAGASGSVAAIVTILTKIFGWDPDKTTAAVSIIAGAMFLIGWGIDKAICKVNKNLDDRLVGIREDIAKNEVAARERSRVHDLALCRLELSDLMNNDPSNIVSIEKKARHYFCDLNGNDGMGERFSAWAKEHNNGNIDVLYCEVEKN